MKRDALNIPNIIYLVESISIKSGPSTTLDNPSDYLAGGWSYFGVCMYIVLSESLEQAEGEGIIPG
jgi:hypothetical protein